MFCLANASAISYKDTNMLKRYLSSFGKIVARKRSGVCMWHQRKLAQAIKRARFMGLLPYVV
jgi:small subunit ribosomal protein S18